MTTATMTRDSGATASGASDTAGTLVGPAGGTWQQGTAARAQCACCGCWVADATVWRYWVGLVAKHTVCVECAESLS